MRDKTEQRAAKAQEKLVDSADTLADSAAVQEDSADRRTGLAADRTLLAAEGTYAVPMLTGLAALAAGAGAQSLLKDLVEPWLGVATSAVLIVFNGFLVLVGIAVLIEIIAR